MISPGGGFLQSMMRDRFVSCLPSGSKRYNPVSRTGLRYLLSDERVSIVLCGPSNTEELEMCASVSDGTHLPEDTIQVILDWITSGALNN